MNLLPPMRTDEPSGTAYRYAVYFAPNPGSLGWQMGSHWLGRCAALLQPMVQPRIEGVTAHDLHRLTAAPRRYGWHATFKAPFVLAPGVDWLTLHQSVQEVARNLAPFALPPLHVQRTGDFLALVPSRSSTSTVPLDAAHAALHAAAEACVRQLRPLAAELSPADLARRRAAGLTARQDDLLRAWGYPFVLDAFRFHMTLTGSLRDVPAALQARVTHAAEEFFADLPMLRFDSLALFAEPTPGADFVLLDHLEVGA